jgi:hypothetical protein
MSSTAQFFQIALDTETIGAGWKLYHYNPGLLTTKNMWQDRAKSTTVAQPIVADANGVVSAYADGLYDLAVYDEDDVLLYTWPNVYFSDQGVLGSEGSSITSANTITLGTQGEIYYHITGSNTIEGISGEQTFVFFTFDSTPTLTHGANFLLRNLVSRTAYVNETVLFVNDGDGRWREVPTGYVSGQYPFPASQNASDDANTLDDYVEDEWEPSIGGNATYTTRIGTYTKIGRQVTVHCKLQINTRGTGSQTTISGFPFTSACYATCPVMFLTLSQNVVYVVGQLDPGQNSITLQSLLAAGDSVNTNTLITDATVIQFSITYHE